MLAAGWWRRIIRSGGWPEALTPATSGDRPSGIAAWRHPDRVLAAGVLVAHRVDLRTQEQRGAREPDVDHEDDRARERAVHVVVVGDDGDVGVEACAAHQERGDRDDRPRRQRPKAWP